MLGHPVKELRILTDRQTGKKRTELHQYRKEPSCDGDLSPCQV